MSKTDKIFNWLMLFSTGFIIFDVWFVGTMMGSKVGTTALALWAIVVVVERLLGIPTHDED